MENLKLRSVRFSRMVLSQANKLGRSLGHGQSSNILRLAIWIGLKALKPGVLHNLMHMMWQEEEGFAFYDIEDVLRTAGVELENLKNQE